MLRMIIIFMGIGAAAALGAWLMPPGMFQRLLVFVVAIMGMIVVGAIPICLLQRLAPIKESDVSGVAQKRVVKAAVEKTTSVTNNKLG